MHPDNTEFDPHADPEIPGEDQDTSPEKVEGEVLIEEPDEVRSARDLREEIRARRYAEDRLLNAGDDELVEAADAYRDIR